MLMLRPYDQVANHQWTRTKSASIYHEYYIKEFGEESIVRPIVDSLGDVKNLPDLVPDAIVILPDHLTIYTMEKENRAFSSMNKECLRPAESAFYVYALNKAGKLIYPVVDRPRQSDGECVCPYEIIPVVQNWHPNRISIPIPPSTLPLLLSNDTDTVSPEGYHPSSPQCNPPHALMARGISSGRFSISVGVKVSSYFCLPENRLPPREVRKVCSVEVIEGYESFDALKVTVTEPAKISRFNDDDRTAKLVLKPGLSSKVSIIGAKGESSASKILPWRFVSFDKVMWTFVPAKKEAEMDVDIEPLSAGGSSLMITGRNPSEKAKGTLRINAAGKVWEIELRVA